MYVRWNRRKRTKEGRHKKRGDYVSAVLVENCRIDGRPRQRTIKFLGSIGEERLDDVFFRKRFWDKVEKNLDSMNLHPDDEKKIVLHVDRVVPKPSDEDVARAHEEAVNALKEIEERLSRNLR